MQHLGMKTMLLFGFALLLSVSDGFAQGRGNNGKNDNNPGRGNNGNNGKDQNPGRTKDGKDSKGGKGVPIDGGASLLLAAGAAYGLKRLKDRRNTET